MPDLTCGEARNLASALFDGELTPDQELAVKDHVDGCLSCPQLYRALVAVHEYLAARRSEAAIPAGLAQRLQRTLADANPGGRTVNQG